MENDISGQILPLTMTRERDFEALTSIRAQSNATVHRSRRILVWTVQVDNKLTSSIKALANGSIVWDDVIKPSKLTRAVYSRIMLKPARNRIIETVHPAKIPLAFTCQLEGADSE